MENKQPMDNAKELQYQVLLDQYKHIELIYNHSSKKYSEMNNTLNWATTIVIGLFIFFSKQISNSFNSINHVFFILSVGSFLILITLFVIFKTTYIDYENRMTKILEHIYGDNVRLKAQLSFDISV